MRGIFAKSLFGVFVLIIAVAVVCLLINEYHQDPPFFTVYAIIVSFVVGWGFGSKLEKGEYEAEYRCTGRLSGIEVTGETPKHWFGRC